MVKRNTWILLIILMGMIGLGWYLSNQTDAETLGGVDSTPIPTPAFLFAQESGQIVSFTLQNASDNYITLKRGAGGVWILDNGLFQGNADQAQAESAATQVSALKIINLLEEIPTLDAVGLQNPDYVLSVVTTQSEQVVQIGDETVTGSGYYVRDTDGQVLIVSKYAIDALLNLFTSPPYAETPTPSP